VDPEFWSAQSVSAYRSAAAATTAEAALRFVHHVKRSARLSMRPGSAPAEPMRNMSGAACVVMASTRRVEMAAVAVAIRMARGARVRAATNHVAHESSALVHPRRGHRRDQACQQAERLDTSARVPSATAGKNVRLGCHMLLVAGVSMPRAGNRKQESNHGQSH